MVVAALNCWHERGGPPSFVTERYGRLADMDRSFDIAYWRLGPAAIFEAAWQLVVDAHMRRPGGADDLRIQRTVAHYYRGQAIVQKDEESPR